MPTGISPSGGNEKESHLGAIWGVAGIFLALFGLWFFAHAYIAMGVFALKRFEIDFIQFFTSGLANVKYYLLNC